MSSENSGGTGYVCDKCTLLLSSLDLMGGIMSSGCARNYRITRDDVECDPVVPGTATRRDPTH